MNLHMSTSESIGYFQALIFDMAKAEDPLDDQEGVLATCTIVDAHVLLSGLS